MNYVCIHGHFYQPPRENPWLEAIERQQSAYPDHDWNEKITHECYAVNAAARVLDDKDRIIKLVNNYERISFNFGPTLLSWLQEKSPEAYQAILTADRASAKRFSGHGSAIAQAYNHPILPLCNDRDRRTQVLWGIRDFEARFGRKPEGMWLPETAVDTASLEVLAEFGIKFTILAPRQAARVRAIGEKEWRKLDGEVDTGRAYLCKLPSGRSINLFFYDGQTSQAIAFEGLLHSSQTFADRLVRPLRDSKGGARLSHVATDGESYGHHHRFGEMALAAALQHLEAQEGVRLTNYGEFLERHPPQMEVQVHENSAWSCAHGLGRWSCDCSCNCGRIENGHQRWREPLRAALDWLRDTVAPAFERVGRELLRDPWAARDRYVDVVLNRSDETIDRFLSACASRTLSDAEQSRVLELMELQRHAMLTYTSCGWFFDDIAGIETVQVIRYAGRVVQLARQALGLELEEEFVLRLEQAEGNVASCPTGKDVYEQSVRPAMVDLLRVGAHYAITSLFNGHGERDRVYCFRAERQDERRRSTGRVRLLIGRSRLVSRITREQADLSYVVLHLGDQHVSCGVREYRGEAAYAEMVKDIEAAFDSADFTHVVRRLDNAFGYTSYTISSLFRDEQHAVVRKILEAPLAQIDSSYRQIYEQHASLARFLKQLDLPVPRRIQMVGGSVLSQEMRGLLRSRRPDLVRLAEIRDEAQRQGIALDAADVGSATREQLARLAGEIRAAAGGDSTETLTLLLELTRFLRTLPFPIDLWPAQQVFIEHVLPRHAQLKGDDGRRKLIERLGEALSVRT